MVASVLQLTGIIAMEVEIYAVMLDIGLLGVRIIVVELLVEVLIVVIAVALVEAILAIQGVQEQEKEIITLGVVESGKEIISVVEELTVLNDRIEVTTVAWAIVSLGLEKLGVEDLTVVVNCQGNKHTNLLFDRVEMVVAPVKTEDLTVLHVLISRVKTVEEESTTDFLRRVAVLEEVFAAEVTGAEVEEYATIGRKVIVDEERVVDILMM